MAKKKYEEETKKLVKEIKEKGTITEQEINLIKNRLNSKKIDWQDVQELSDLAITTEQTEKGLKWLINKWKSPKGKERINNPFGYREQNVLDNFEQFRFNSFTNKANYQQDQLNIRCYVPVYDVIGKDTTFQYLVWEGIEIIG